MAPDSVWEIVFLMVILKIPIVYLCTVVWYAIKAEPRHGPGKAGVRVQPDDLGPGGGPRRRSRRLPPPRPHGGPSRAYPRTPRTAFARARAERR